MKRKKRTTKKPGAPPSPIDSNLRILIRDLLTTGASNDAIAAELGVDSAIVDAVCDDWKREGLARVNKLVNAENASLAADKREMLAEIGLHGDEPVLCPTCRQELGSTLGCRCCLEARHDVDMTRRGIESIVMKYNEYVRVRDTQDRNRRPRQRRRNSTVEKKVLAL